MLQFKINEKKCTQCGLCARECPMMIIDGTGIPQIKEGKEPLCLKCQHCLAVCPTGALSIFGKKPGDSVSATGEMPNPESMARMMKTRRSIRRYKNEELDKELINDLIETAAYAPTGHNKNSVLFSVADNMVSLDKMRGTVYNALKKEIDNGNEDPHLQYLSKFSELWEKKKVDILFRRAPHVVIASAPQRITTPDADCWIALSYFELLANSHGLGTLWNDYLKWAININPETKTKLGIPKDHIIGCVMLFGKPDVKFARSIQNEGLPINRMG